MNPSRRAVALTAAGVVGALAAGVGIGAGVYATVAPATTTTTVIESSGTGPSENTAATVPGGLSVNTIYQRTNQGVVDITVGSSQGPRAPQDRDDACRDGAQPAGESRVVVRARVRK